MIRRNRALLVLLALLSGCDFGGTPPPSDTTAASEAAQQGAPTANAPPTDAPPPDGPHHVDSRPPPMHQPVPLWEGGQPTGRDVDAATAEDEGYIVLDLGEAWTPYIFTEGNDPAGTPEPNEFRPTYLALARGDFPDDRHGDRARTDQYLELFGIPPTLALLRTRMRATAQLDCAPSLDLTPLANYDGGTLAHRSNDTARRDASRYDGARRALDQLLAAHHVAAITELDAATLTDRERTTLDAWNRFGPRGAAIRALQERLRCEGYYAGVGRPVLGGFDWATRDALAKFEKRHRVYGLGFVGQDTLAKLRLTPMENDRADLVRVLTERAVHAAGVIEDGSTSGTDAEPRTYRGTDGQPHRVPNLEDDVERAVVDAFGLQTPEATLAFLEGLGELPIDGHRLVAIRRPALPEYYDGDMDLSVEIDRGDVWYDFPYDEQGVEHEQPVRRRPHLTIFTTWQGQRIALARFGTTIGGWRSEYIEQREWWKYKESPAGPVMWAEIVGAPVWVPPESTPPRDLIQRARRRHAGGNRWEVDYDEMGPGYASAYGLVAAYHKPYREDADGSVRFTGDQGIRTHGSVDYMSIMRRHSHGCHRLHNHIAVRLMSFVLAHRHHTRRGMDHVFVERVLEHDGEQIPLELKEAGYVFSLERPVRVEVLEGHIQGELQSAVEIAIPKYDPANAAYMMPDGTAVAFRHGVLVPVPLPQVLPDGGVPLWLATALAGGGDAGVPIAPRPAVGMDAGVARPITTTPWGTTAATATPR